MRRIYFRITLDTTILALLTAGAIVMKSSLVHPHEKGFFLDDESIRYPNKSTYTSFNRVIFVGGAFNMFWILLVETLLGAILPRSLDAIQLETDVEHIPFLNAMAPRLFLVHLIVNFIMGAGFTNLLTEVPKYSFGRLRPNFFNICNPAIFTKTPPNEPTYIDITEYNCTGNHDEVRDARLSFPSGHSSMAMYFATYMVVYSYLRLRRVSPVRNSLFLLSLCCYSVMISVVSLQLGACQCHWGDAVAGLLIGLLVAVATLTLFTELGRLSPQIDCITKVDYRVRETLEEKTGSFDEGSAQTETSPICPT